MANYTVSLYEIMNDPDYNTRIFPTYTLYDNTHKAELEGKILATYISREICVETVEAWLYKFQSTFLNYLPKANLMYQLMSNTITNLISRETHRTGNDDSTRTDNLSEKDTGTISVQANGSQKVNNTPYTNYPSGTNYASNTGDTSNNQTTTPNTTRANTGTQTRDRDYGEDVTYTDETKAQIAEKIAEAYLNVDLLFIQALADCFLAIY